MRVFLPLLALLAATACTNTPPPQSPKSTSADSSATAPPVAVAPPPPPSPPPPDYDTLLWADLARLDSSLAIDMRYATTENFVGEKMYDCGRCFLRPAVARAVLNVQQKLAAEGLGLKLLDCYRPRPVQQKLWEKVPDPRYVTDPQKGSMHNRGAAVDLTLVDKRGRELDMGTPYDYFGPEAYPAYDQLPDSILSRRQLLRQAMIAEGFRPIRTEWWHFAYTRKNYALSDDLWNCP